MRRLAGFSCNTFLVQVLPKNLQNGAFRRAPLFVDVTPLAHKGPL
jgi:hypothetical protein